MRMSSKNEYAFDWSDVAFSKTKKKAISDLKATLIAAPRQISKVRFAQLIKHYLPAGPIILGLAKEPYVLGFEDQPQFKTLTLEDAQEVIGKVNASAAPHKIYTLTYAQRETKYVFSSLKFRSVLLLNGSWKYTFHTQEPYYALTQKGTPYEMLSPFASEGEARAYAAELKSTLAHDALSNILNSVSAAVFTEDQMLDIASRAATLSYDYSFQTGVALGKSTAEGYELLGHAFNKVVPFQTYAMHYGASREKHFSPPHDLNHYDTVHAEVELLITAQKEGIDLKGTTLFINLLPCPACSRMLSETEIEEFVYTVDHSEGYAIQLLEKAGKKVRRVVPPVDTPALEA